MCTRCTVLKSQIEKAEAEHQSPHRLRYELYSIEKLHSFPDEELDRMIDAAEDHAAASFDVPFRASAERMAVEYKKERGWRKLLAAPIEVLEAKCRALLPTGQYALNSYYVSIAEAEHARLEQVIQWRKDNPPEPIVCAYCKGSGITHSLGMPSYGEFQRYGHSTERPCLCARRQR